MKKTAVVLFNLGGPSKLQDVRPFLFNLFNDPHMIPMPQALRTVFATVISSLRYKKSQKSYSAIGGGSPIGLNTASQAQKLQSFLGNGYKTFVAMSYWDPYIQDVVQEVKQYNPGNIILLPLYPQYSTTTTKSSFYYWDKFSENILNIPTRKICCYPTNAGFINQIVHSLQNLWPSLDLNRTHFLFSAHGLPLNRILSGDPYQNQIEATRAEIMRHLPPLLHAHTVYQSRVGPMKWTGPSIAQVLSLVGTTGGDVVVIPISFVNEHVETLYELDIQYKDFAQQAGVRNYHRLPTVGDGDLFIKGLQDLIQGQGCQLPSCGIECAFNKGNL